MDSFVELMERDGIESIQSHHVSLVNSLQGRSDSALTKAATKARLASQDASYIAALSNRPDMSALYNYGGLLYDITNPTKTDTEKKNLFTECIVTPLIADVPELVYILNAEFISDAIKMKWACDPYEGMVKCQKGLGGLAFLLQTQKVNQQLVAKYQQLENLKNATSRDIDALRAVTGPIPITPEQTKNWLGFQNEFWKKLLDEGCVPCIFITDIKRLVDRIAMHYTGNNWQYKFGNPIFYNFCNGMKEMLDQQPTDYMLENGYCIIDYCPKLDQLIQQLQGSHVPTVFLPPSLRRPNPPANPPPPPPTTAEVQLIGARQTQRTNCKRKDRYKDRGKTIKANRSEEHKTLINECFKISRSKSGNKKFSLSKLMELANPGNKTHSGLANYLQADNDTCMNLTCIGHCTSKKCQETRKHTTGTQKFNKDCLFRLLKKYKGN